MFSLLRGPVSPSPRTPARFLARRSLGFCGHASPSLPSPDLAPPRRCDLACGRACGRRDVFGRACGLAGARAAGERAWRGERCRAAAEQGIAAPPARTPPATRLRPRSGAPLSSSPRLLLNLSLLPISPFFLQLTLTFSTVLSQSLRSYSIFIANTSFCLGISFSLPLDFSSRCTKKDFLTVLPLLFGHLSSSPHPHIHGHTRYYTHTYIERKTDRKSDRHE